MKLVFGCAMSAKSNGIPLKLMPNAQDAEKYLKTLNAPGAKTAADK
jgi:hypothetical protein